MAPRGRATQQSRDIRHQEDKLSKATSSLSHQDDCKTRMDTKPHKSLLSLSMTPFATYVSLLKYMQQFKIHYINIDII